MLSLRRTKLINSACFYRMMISVVQGSLSWYHFCNNHISSNQEIWLLFPWYKTVVSEKNELPKHCLSGWLLLLQLKYFFYYYYYRNLDNLLWDKYFLKYVSDAFIICVKTVNTDWPCACLLPLVLRSKL